MSITCLWTSQRSDLNSLYEALVERSIDHMLRLGICMIFMCVIIIISFRKLDLTSQTSNICNILSPLYHAYFQQIALAVFKVAKQCLIWDFFCGFFCWTPGHGQKSPMKEGLFFHLSVRPIVCLSSCLAVRFLGIGSFVFSEA